MSADLLMSAPTAGGPVPSGRRPLLSAVLRAVGTMALVLAVVVGLWVLALRVFDVSTYVGKGPMDVVDILFVD